MKQHRGVPALIPFLVAVSVIFIGILIFAYVESKKANPQMLDEHGRIKSACLWHNPGPRPLAPGPRSA